jgi:acyl-CoA thioesterase
MFADLAADTAVRADPDTPGRFHVALPDHWDYLLPSGGVVMTCALRVAEAAVADPAMRVASATTIFATPIHPGKLIGDAVVIRRGRSAAQVRVTMRHAEAPQPSAEREPASLPAAAGPEPGAGLEMIATLLRDRRGPDVIGVAFPDDVRALADALPVDDGAPNNPHVRFRFFQQLECRIGDCEPSWRGAPVAGPARYARWMRYRVPQRDARGRLDPLALPPLIDTMPPALQRAIGPGGYRFYAPSLDLTTYFVDDTDRDWVLVDVTVRRARMGWAIADAQVWDDARRLIAYGSQAMFLHTVAGEPPVIDASGR